MLEMISSALFSCAKDTEKLNQDNILAPKRVSNGYLFAVADGVGSYEGARQASSIAIDYLSNLTEISLDKSFEFSLNNIVDEIAALTSIDPNYDQAATTLTMCFVNETGLKVVHVGDSRLYLKVGLKLEKITTDHTQHQKLLDAGLFTAKQLKNMSGKNVLTTALSKKIQLEIQETFISLQDLLDENGDFILHLMSDGAYHYWEKRPKFSEKTLNNPSAFSTSLQRRIEKNGAVDDYSLVSVKFRAS